MTRKHLTENLFAIILGSAMLTLLAGCGTAPAESDTDPLGTTTTSSDEDLIAGATPDRLESAMVGIWLGTAYLDEQKLDQIMMFVPEEDREVVLKGAQTFLSTVMAKDFRPDGSLENDIEVTPFGEKPQRLGGMGTWEVLKAEDDRVVVQTTTELPDGTTVTEKQLYRFFPEGDRLALRVSMEGPLGKCAPLIILNRQKISPTNLAEQSDDKQLK